MKAAAAEWGQHMCRTMIRIIRSVATIGISAAVIVAMSACSTDKSTAQISTQQSYASASVSGDDERSPAPSPSINTPSHNSSSSNAATTNSTSAQEYLGSYSQLFADPILAQCMAEIMDQHVDDQLTRKAAEDLTGIGGIGVSNGFGLPDTEHPDCGIKLKNLTSLSGIEHFSNIQTISLDGLTHLSDLRPIRGLNRLMSVRLLDTAVTDYSQLDSPTRIFNLDVYISSDMPAPTIEQQRAWRINIINQ